jgi:Zn-finger in Ran binding protein and others
MATNAAEAQDWWACEACTFHNRLGTAACEVCGTPAPAGTAAADTGSSGSSSSSGSTAAAASSSSAAAGYWSCAGCTMQNLCGTFACFMCGTVDDAQRALAVSSNSGSSRSSSSTNSSGMTPALLEQLARDAHFSLTTHLTELVHRLALISAQAEAGMGRVTQDPAYIRVLINIMKSYCAQPAAAAAGSQETPLLACRGLNYYLSLGASYTAEVGRAAYSAVQNILQ